MGASGLPDLRELAMLGFGTFSEKLLGPSGSGQVYNVYNIDLPSGAAGGQKTYQLVGYLKQQEAPGLFFFRFGLGQLPPGSSDQIMSSGQVEPVMRFLSPDQPRLSVGIVNQTRYLDAYVVTPLFFVGLLTGQAEQLQKLIAYLGNRMAPPSLIEEAIDAASSLLGYAPTGDW